MNKVHLHPVQLGRLNDVILLQTQKRMEQKFADLVFKKEDTIIVELPNSLTESEFIETCIQHAKETTAVDFAAVQKNPKADYALLCQLLYSAINNVFITLNGLEEFGTILTYYPICQIWETLSQKLLGKSLLQLNSEEWTNLCNVLAENICHEQIKFQ